MVKLLSTSLRIEVSSAEAGMLCTLATGGLKEKSPATRTIQTLIAQPALVLIAPRQRKFKQAAVESALSQIYPPIRDRLRYLTREAKKLGFQLVETQASA
jgi:hypothetical protein